MISIVACGTDGSETANVAVSEAAEIARRYGAKLCLLSVAGHAGMPSEDQNIELQWATNPSAVVKSQLEKTASDLRASGLECETRMDEGDPAEVLVQLATACGADLLVIGNKGMKRRVLGSVPNSVTHQAACSVLVVKTT
jgi:nucleotide-binding universal stress UspA family protein